MAKTILITGGAASGKTRWAVTNFSACERVLYLAVADKADEDTLKRIEYDRKQNNTGWDILTGVKGYVTVSEVGEIPLKGKSKGVFVYSVTGVDMERIRHDEKDIGHTDT